MWTGIIMQMDPPEEPGGLYTIWIETDAGELKKDCVTEEVWATLEYGQTWTQTNPC